MDKNMNTKELLFALLATMVAMFIVIIATAPAFAEPYPKAGVVLEAQPLDNELLIVDGAGEAWVTAYIPRSMEGDIVSFLMDDNGTPSIYDDVGAVQPHMYTRAGRIASVDKHADEYSVTDNFGEGWILTEVEDNAIGDGVVIMMFDNNTPNYVHDDVVVKCHYSGL